MIIIYLLLISFLLYQLQRVIYQKFWDKNLIVDMSFSRTEAFEGESVTLLERVANGKWLPLPYVNINFRMSHKLPRLSARNEVEVMGEERNSVFIVPMNKAISKKTALFCSKRGYYKVEGAVVSSDDIFVSSILRREDPVRLSLMVFPKMIEADEQAIPYKQLMGNILTKRYIMPDPFEFGGIREYQPFDSFNQINFRAWAKTGELQSNIYANTVSQHVKIILNTMNYNEYKRDYVHENAIRLAAFLARTFIETGIPVGLTATSADIITGMPGKVDYGLSSRHLTEIYGTLARINLEEPAVPVSEVMEYRFFEEEVIILISSYTDDSLCRWFDSISPESRLWIITKSAEDTAYVPPYDKIAVWEVQNE